MLTDKQMSASEHPPPLHPSCLPTQILVQVHQMTGGDATQSVPILQALLGDGAAAAAAGASSPTSSAKKDQGLCNSFIDDGAYGLQNVWNPGTK